MRTENEIDQQTASDRLYVGMQFALRRESLGLSAETVAEQAGYSITQYTLMEEGKRSISASDYFRVSDVWYDYEDSEYPAFYRKLKKIGRKVKREFFLYEEQIQLVFPAAIPLFVRFPLRYIVAVILVSGPLLMMASDIVYYVGYALGWLVRVLQG
ncbi:MAG: helix-turn-helix transcriptional regulator, partial [Daejeonella sp.]|uniref:helix-turn-helix domain-containing protein n=1 Tax=Daejeonella sp. TaxID=2805397 RepID=UPI003C711F07